MVDTALRSYPELAQKKGDFLNRQLYSITMQQAAKDYETAEFYRRTGHPCSAYFCYEIVRRRYPNTRYFDQATERMNQLRTKLEKTHAEAGLKVPPPGSGPVAPQTAADSAAALPGQSAIAVPPRQLPPSVVNDH